MAAVIDVDDPRADDVRQLLAAHLVFANEHSPPEDVHALDIDGLCQPTISFFSYRDNGVLLGVGALKHLNDTHAELKSMHTAIAARGQGIGKAMLGHLIETARERSYKRVSLETGSMEAFAAARHLYKSEGFILCEPFAQYTKSPYSVCMTLEL